METVGDRVADKNVRNDDAGRFHSPIRLLGIGVMQGRVSQAWVRSLSNGVGALWHVLGDVR